MADKRISQLIERVDIANNDVLPIVASGATTTNKVTISTIQDWMQENLDVGVTSVGITLGSSGTDVNVTGSPITTSGNITINIPTASATNRGLLSSSDWSSFNGKVPYSGATGAVNLGYNALSASQININGASPTGGSYLGFKHSTSVTTGTDGYTSMYTFGTNNIGFQSVSGATQKDFSFSMVGITAGVPGGRVYNLPDASGTLALTSDLSGYVTLGTAQTITAQKTFTTSGGSDTLIVDHTSGSGIAVDISKAGNGEGLRVAKTSGSGNAVTITGGLLSAEAGTFSGELQSTTRVIANTGGQSIILTANSGGTTNRIEGSSGLPMHIVTSGSSLAFAAGGTTPQITLASTGAVTLTGALNGTSASFSGTVSTPFIGVTGSTGQIGNINSTNANGGYITWQTSGTTIADLGSAQQIFGAGGSDTFGINARGARSLMLGTNDTTRLTLSSTGAVTLTGALNGTSANFSGSVGAASLSGAFATLSNYGSATSTALQLGDANNGLFRPALNSVAIATNGASALTLASTGAATFSSSVTAGAAINLPNNFSLTGRNAANTLNISLISRNTSDRVIIDVDGYGTNIGGGGTVLINPTGGSVGIGTAAPSERLEVSASGNVYAKITSTTNGGNSGIRLNSTNAREFGIFSDGALRFYDFTDATERMRITSGGYLWSTNSSYSGSSANHQFNNNANGNTTINFYHQGTDPYGLFTYFTGSAPNNTSNYFAYFRDTSGAKCVIFSNGNIQNSNNSYGAISDIKLKENIEDATPKLDDLMKVKVRNYNLIGDDKKQIGVIAQELEEVFPAMIDESEDFEEVEVPQIDEEGNEILNEEGEVVTENKRVSKGTTTKSVKYSVFVPMLIKAMQEQQEQIKSLTEQVEALKSQING